MSYDRELEAVSTLVNALGAGLATWGIINLLEAYGADAEREQTAADYHSRISEIDMLVRRLYEDICYKRGLSKPSNIA